MPKQFPKSQRSEAAKTVHEACLKDTSEAEQAHPRCFESLHGLFHQIAIRDGPHRLWPFARSNFFQLFSRGFFVLPKSLEGSEIFTFPASFHFESTAFNRDNSQALHMAICDLTQLTFYLNMHLSFLLS